MAEGFVLNIPQEMLNRLQKADEKIEKLDKASRRVGENIRLAFEQGAKGVDKFIGSLNSAQKILDGFKDKKINVGLNLDPNAIANLKKQLEGLGGVNIPVTPTATGGGSSSSGGSAGESQSLKELLNGIVTLTKSVENLTQKIDGIKVTGSGSTSGGGTSNGEKTDKGIGSYKSKINELLQIKKLIYDIQKAQSELDKKGSSSLSGRSLSSINELKQQADKVLLELLQIEDKTERDLSAIQTKWHTKELALEQKQAKDNIAIQEKEANDLIKIEEREVKEYERLMGKMLKLRKDINTNTNLTYSSNPKVAQDALSQIAKQEALLKQFEARAKTLEGKYGTGLSEIQVKYSQKELEMLNKAVNNPASNSGIDQKTKDLREYEKVLKRISDLEKIRDKASNAIGKYGANSQIGQQANALYQQAERMLQQHNQRRIALEQQYGTQLVSIKQAQNAKDLNYLIQQKDAELRVIEQAEQKALQQYTKLANERNRLLTEQYNNQKILNNPKTDNATRQKTSQQQQLIADELQRNKQAMLNIEQKYQSKLATIQQQAGQQELQRLRREQQDKINEVRRALERRRDIEKRWAQRNARNTEAYRNTATGAMDFSQNEAKTINQKIQAIKHLKKAQRDLDMSNGQNKKTFRELGNEINRQERELRRLGVQMNSFQQNSRRMFDIAGQLGRALSLMFSVSQIGQYISKMVNVRKEMELQQRSLQVLLQSKDKANELWNQTLDLAVKSPFRVKELVTYTKQLAAYRIESDKLFETNKMLADVSAGLGVDMQRLILAFGQVKSASFLRGCLGKGTPIRLYNEDIKEVQNIVVGDVIMGDDNTPRNIKEIIYGKEQMYIVKQGVFGDDYRVNENHILTLKDKITDTIVDVYVKDYLKDKERYNGVKIGKNNNIIDYPIELIKDNIDEYFGFVIDGNKRFLLGDGTITHNTELRQFTEAGIPMLEELSKYFSEIYGKSISVAEVFDMISKRMVTFTDVEAVFQRMTGSGGVFFNMQEELSQTTAGMISNLQDSIDLMLNDMGKKNQGIINTTIKFMKWLVDSWKGVSNVMKGILVILSGYIGATAKWGNMAKNVGNIFTSIFSGAGLLSMGITVAIALLVKLGMEAVRYNKTLKNIHKEHEKFRESLNDIELGFAELYRNGVDDIDEYKGKLQELMSIAKQSYNIDMDFQINNLNSIDEVARKFDELKEKILSFDNLSLEFDIDFAEQSDRGWELFQDYLEKDLEQLAARQSDIKKLASDLRGELTGQIKNVAEFQRLEEEYTLSLNNAKKIEDEYFKLVGEGKIEEAEPIGKAMDAANKQTYELKKRIIELKEELGSVDIDIVSSLFPRGVDESEYEYLQRVAEAITDIYNESKNIDKKIYASEEDYIAKMFGVDMQSATSIYKKISDIASKYNKDLTQATKELNDFLAKTQTEVANLVNTSLRYEVNVSGLLDEIEKSYFSGNDTLEQTASKVLQGKGYTLTEEFYELLEKYVDRAIYSKDEVNGVFANLSDIIENQYLSKEVSSYVYGGLKNLATEKEWDETLFHEILSQAEEYYQNALKDDEGNLVLEGLKLDLIPEKEKSSEIELKEWQKAYNEEVDDIMDYLDADGDSIFMPLKIRADVQGVATTKEKQLDVLNQAIDDAQKKINNFKIANTYLTQEIEKVKNALNEDISIDTRNEYEDKLERYNKLWNENVEKQEKYVEHLIHLRNLLGGDDDKDNKGRNKKNKIIQEQIALIKTLYDEYQKLSKEMTSEDSKRNILDRFSDYAKELKIDIEKIDFTNLQGVIEAYESLKDRAKAAGDEVYREFLKTFSETTVEIELMYHIKERERITNEIQELFSDYEMTVDLKKIDIPRNLAEDLFDVDWTELSDVKERLDKEKNILVNQNKEIEKEVSDRYSKDVNDTVLESLKAQAKGNKERIAIIDKFLEQWNELEKKASEERIKTYYKYLLEEQHEQVKIRLETLKKLNEVDAEDKFTKEQKITIKTKIREEQDEKMAQQRWKDFETSPMYLSLFEDIDSMSNGALEQMIDTMDKLKGQLIEMGLPASDLKQILNQIDRVEEELEKRQPFKNFADNAKTAFKRSKELLELEQKRARQQKKYDNAKSMYDLYQNSLAHAQTTLDNTEFEKGSIEYTALETAVNNLLRSTNKWAKEVEKAEGDLSNTNTAIVEVNQSSMDFYNQLKDIGTLTQSVSGGMWDIVGAIHGIPEETKETLDYLGKLEQGVANIVGGILRIIYEDKIAGIAQLVDGLFSTVALIIDWTSGVRKANKEIERQRRILSNLTNEYERLNKELDKAWNVDNIRDYNSEMKRNLEEQIEYQKKIVATYEDMKGADKEGSVEWERVKDAEQELHNLYEQQEEMRNNMVSKLTGIAVDDVVSAAESWVDAWYEAFKETGDGLKGLEDNFNEVILNMVKRQASMKIAGKFIDEWNDALDRYVKDGYLGNSEMESYFYKVKNDLPALSSQLETFFASFDNILGDTSGNLSTLQRGIQGISESQADILASYLNSIRFIVSDSNSQLKALLAVQSNANSNTNNPILEQIRIIARNTQMLYDFFSGMTASWNGNGRGLKVVL